MSAWPISASGNIMPLSYSRAPQSFQSGVTGPGAEPIIKGQLAVGIQRRHPGLSASLALQDQIPLVDDGNTQAVQFGRGHVADIFLVRSFTIQKSHRAYPSR